MPKFYCKKCQFRTVRKEKLNDHLIYYHSNDNKIKKYFNLNNFLKSKIIVDINKIISSFNVPIEGSCLYENNTSFKFRINTDVDILRNNLYRLAEISNNILEIGFNGGHSAALYLYANKDIQILSFDICFHKYTLPIVDYLKKNNNLKFIKGDSLIEVPKYNSEIKYDVIHIDGGHGIKCAKNDLINCKKFASKNTFLVFDDSNDLVISKLLNEYITNNFIKEINYEKYGLKSCFYHKIFNYCF
jgi:hypothetical protein